MMQILLTGATGTIGSALVLELLKNPQSRLTLLVRARDSADLQARMASMHKFWGLPADQGAAQRIQAVLGDIVLPDFGLNADELQRLASDTTHIIHCAASVKLNMSLDEARATAVKPTRSILALARRCAEAGQLQKVDLVSTVGVWGRTPGHMPEQRLPDVTDFHNTYEAAKAEAERVVWAEGDGLPITVHRPSMVVGNASDGKVIHFQVFYHLCEFLSGGRTFGVMPRLGDTQLDTVPVDWVAQAVAWSSARAETAGRIFHLCSGPAGAISLPRLQQAVRQAWQQRGRKLPTLRPIEQAWLERLIPLIGAVAGEKTRRALRGLPPVLAYLAEDQGFTNTETQRTFAAAGLPLPPVESYLVPVLNHYLDTVAGRGRP